MAYSETVEHVHGFPVLQSLSLADDPFLSGLKVHSTLTVEHEGHKVSYRIIGITAKESVGSGKSTKLDLEVVKVYY